MLTLKGRMKWLACGLLLAAGPIGCGGGKAPPNTGTAGVAEGGEAAQNGQGAQQSGKQAASDDQVRTPATVAEAAKVLDLRTFPLLEGAKDPNQTLAGLTYRAPGKTQAAYQFQKAAMEKRGFRELDGAQVTDQYASGTFQHPSGFLVSVSVTPAGGASDPLMVSFSTHGNVNLRKLPVPAGAKETYFMPIMASYVTDAPVDKTAAEIAKLLQADGWQPYGEAGDVKNYKQNAIQLSARVLAAPGQGGKTSIMYSTELMSADLPAPPEAVRVQYSDSTKALSLDFKGTQQDLVKFYREALAAGGWKATTEEPIKIGFRHVVIFRNPAKELLEVEMNDVDGLTRALVKFQTAEEVAELDRKAKELAAKAQAKANQPNSQLAIKLPADAAKVQQSAPRRIEFSVPNGQAKAAVEAIRKTLLDAGWKEESAMLEAMFGDVKLTKDDQSVSMTYVDTGVVPSEITVTGSGVDLRQAK